MKVVGLPPAPVARYGPRWMLVVAGWLQSWSSELSATVTM
jgi:hypothetical protein